MKEKIKFLIFGMLIGAVITASIFLLVKGKSKEFDRMPMMNGEKFEFDESKMPPDFDRKRSKDNKRDNSNVTSKPNDETNNAENSSSAEAEVTDANTGV